MLVLAAVALPPAAAAQNPAPAAAPKWPDVRLKPPHPAGKTAPEAEAFLASRGLIVRGVANYGLPGHLRITLGLEEHNRALVAALAEFLGRAG